MSPVGITARRTIGMARNLYSTALAVGGFLAAAAVSFAFALESAEGSRLMLASVWAAAVSPLLPVLAAILSMDVWSDERLSGRIDLLLSAPVRERHLTLGKFFGVFVMCIVTLLVSFVGIVIAMRWYSPALYESAGFAYFIPAFVALALQTALWCAVSVALSALFSHAAAAATASIALLVGVPRGGWATLVAWAPQGRTAFGEMPLDVHALDMAGGVFSVATVSGYIVFTVLALFLATKFVASLRFVGRGASGLRVSTLAAMFLASVTAVAAVLLACRLDVSLDMQLSSGRGFSARTRDILGDSRGEVQITAFLSRKDPRFRSLGHFLRSLQREAESLCGVTLELRFVDPAWDLGPAERLVRSGAPENSLVFEKGRRMAVLPLADGYGERECASVILRLTTPPQRRTLYWTCGHGEAEFDGYGPWGMSDIARDLQRDGYRNQRIDLTGDAQIPSDCALILVAGARDGFSRAESGRIDSYLRQGGRLLVLMNSAEEGGVSELLPRWGMRPASVQLQNVKTLSGSDVIVSSFSAHPVVEHLAGSQVVLENPVSFMPSAAAETGAGADRIEFMPMATCGGGTVAAAVERGLGAGDDIAIRPTRIIAVGDTSFVMNAQLATRANANRDFFLNCVAYLSGTDASTSSGTETDLLVSGMDRAVRLRFMMVIGGGIPAVVFLVMVFSAFRRRRRRK